jgi:hypothetical protein
LNRLFAAGPKMTTVFHGAPDASISDEWEMPNEADPKPALPAPFRGVVAGAIAGGLPVTPDPRERPRAGDNVEPLSTSPEPQARLRLSAPGPTGPGSALRSLYRVQRWSSF